MRTPIEAEQFLATPGLEAWELEAGAATIVFRTADFTSGARFALEVAAIADELDHHPDLDLRYGSVTMPCGMGKTLWPSLSIAVAKVRPI